MDELVLREKKSWFGGYELNSKKVTRSAHIFLAQTSLIELQ